MLFSLCICRDIAKLEYRKISDGSTKLSLKQNLNPVEEIYGRTKLVQFGESHTADVGLPELPTYTTLYQLDPYKEYEFNIIVNESYVEQNIDIHPHQGSKSELEYSIDSNFYNSNQVYPEKNINVSDRKRARGMELVTLEVIPFLYHPKTKSLEVFSDIEIEVKEVGEHTPENITNIKTSRIFEKLFQDIVINYESTTREGEYQEPSILYICGGSSINNSSFQELLEWRHQQGYIVNAVTLSTTGSSANSIKNYIQDAYYEWDNPPEYVALVGDVNGSYTVPTFYNGFGHNEYGNYCEGDLPYSQLDGDDLLPEVLVGRISVQSSSDISVIVAKTLAYEKASYIEGTGTDWYESAALVGDPSSSGNSTIFTNMYIDDVLTNHSFDNVQTKYSGGFASWMEDRLEDGVLYFNYRGFIGVSNFDNNDINGANNGYMNPFATILTCGTGSFDEDGTCISEQMLRAGTVQNPKGAVAAVSTATWNTHTLFNNIVDMGIYDGIFSRDLTTTGAALANGKLALLNTYPTHLDWVGAFTQWNNLMGDPAIPLWTDTPTVMAVDYPQSINLGTNVLDVDVFDSDGDPIENARVTLTKDEDEIFDSVLSDINGRVTLNWESNTSGTAILTVVKENKIPYQDEININDNGYALYISSIEINDINGNEDGNLNPGEGIELSLGIGNEGNGTALNVTAQVSSNSDVLQLGTESVTYGNINPGGFGTSQTPFYLSLNPDVIDSENLDIRLEVLTNNGTTVISVPINVLGYDIKINNLVVDNHNVDIGESNSFTLNLFNEGSITVEDMMIQLSSYGNIITTSSSIVYVDQISSGQEIETDPFIINVNENAIGGSIIPLSFTFSNSNGFQQEQTYEVQLGQVSVTDPLGPDGYGYYIYDSGDIGYDLAPEYEWIELESGLGTDLNLNNSGNGNSNSSLTALVNLPFNFRFYGIDYNQITVGAGGWIAFGDHSVPNFRNYPIPGAGGPSPMVAAFWDDLITTSGGDVYSYVSDEYVVVQWDAMETCGSLGGGWYGSNCNGGDYETFEIIIYNNEYQEYVSETGDGQIKIQYQDFNNTSNGNWSSYPPAHGSYATIGIENHLGDIGLQYSYDNNYPNAAMVLHDNDALLITTTTNSNYMLGDINADEEINILDVVMMVNIVLGIIEPDGYEAQVADYNEDGQINILDVVQLVNLIIGA